MTLSTDELLTEFSELEPAGAFGLAELERLAIIKRTGLLSDGADATLDSFARLAATLLDAPAAYVTLVTDDRQVSPGAVELDRLGDPVRTVPISESICQFQVSTGVPMLISDTRTDLLSRNKASVVDGSVQAYAGVPLNASGGHVLGGLCVVDRRPRAWTGEQVLLLRDLAALVSKDLADRLGVGSIVGVQGLGRRLEVEVQALLDAVSGLVEMAEQQPEPSMQRYAALARARSVRVAALAAELGKAAAPRSSFVGYHASSVDLVRSVERVADGMREATGSSDVSLQVPAEPLLISCDPVRLERALTHLLVSTHHHTAGGESVRVQLSGISTKDAEGAGRPKAELRVSALGTQIPAAELGRIVARFQAASNGKPVRKPRPAAMRIFAGETHVSNGAVEGRSSPHGLTFRAEWNLVEPVPSFNGRP